jgi:biofilm PGA synthesis N-glycosyltransferase PgaC
LKSLNLRAGNLEDGLQAAGSGARNQSMRADNFTYVLITPARNEEAFIEQTIRSVISQTVLPQKWVIVSDGSTDRTDDIVKAYLPNHPWMELVRMPERRDRHFAAKVGSFNAGYERVRRANVDVIGNLDADITFDSDYFEFLLARFAADATLGVAGTPFVEGTTSYDFRFTSMEHVSGACQLFRRECFEQIGGYVPVKGGGIDWIAVTSARMNGWQTRTFVERVCHHHRPMGTASAGKLRAIFKLGRQDYYLGGHPLWQMFRSCYQMGRKPYLLGGLSLLLGYGSAWIARVQRPVSPELIRFHQHEQMQRLRQSLFKTT